LSDRKNREDAYTLKVPHGGAKTGFSKGYRNNQVGKGSTLEDVKSVITKAKRMMHARPEENTRTPVPHRSKGN
jgi:hypothetical protein